MLITHLRPALALFVCGLASSNLIAGVVFEIETRNHDQSRTITETSTVYAEGLSLKMETVPAGRQAPADTMIFRGDRREMVVIDHQRQTYMVIDQQFVANMMGQLQQVAGQMQGMLDNVPADQRALMDQMMKRQGPQSRQMAAPQIDVRGAGKQAQVYGYPCTLFVVTQDGRKVRDVWITDWNNIQGGRELAATFDSMSEFTSKLTAAIPTGGETPMQNNAFATIKRMGGFPVAAREYREDGSIDNEWALRSATVQRISLAELQPPNGYQQQSMLGGSSMGQSPNGFGQLGQGQR